MSYFGQRTLSVTHEERCDYNFLLFLNFVICEPDLNNPLSEHTYYIKLVMLASRRSLIIMNLSKDVFERRTSTGSGLFSFLDSGFAHLLGQLVSIIAKTLRNTNLGASTCFKMKKTSLPVDVRRSKTPLLKLPNNEGVPQIKPYVTSQKLLDSPSTFNAQKTYTDSEAFWSYLYVWFGFLSAQVSSRNARQWSRRKFPILSVKPFFCCTDYAFYF